MLRTRKFTAILVCIFVPLFVIASLSGCSGKFKDKNERIDPRGGIEKPQPSDFEGPVADFDGKWTGPCKLFPDEGSQLECTAEVDIRQVSMLQTETITFTFKYRLGNRELSSPLILPPYFIRQNSLSDGTKTLGQIGRGAFSVVEPTFAGFVVRQLGGKIGVMAVRVPSLNFTDDAFTFDLMAASSACPSGYCFQASLSKK